MDGKLEKDFFAFARRVPGAEVIDDLPLTQQQNDSRKADIFFDHRSVITEVKLLATDTAEKAERILEPHRVSEHWPHFYGSWPISKLLPYLPDRDEVQRALLDAVASAIPNLVRKANRQIRETKKSFNLPASKGLQVVLNDSIDILPPNVIAFKIAEALNKKNPDGSVQHPEIAFVWILSETHTVDVRRGLPGLLSVMLDNPLVNDSGRVEGCVESLQPLWASFNGMPFFRADAPVGDLNAIPLQSVRVKSEDRPMTRSDLWRHQYAANPYLRPLTEEQLLDYGAKLTTDVGKRFLVGSTVTKAEIAAGLERWAHLIEEINHRGVDMRKLKPYLDRYPLP
jgi:hypothetical protein